MAIPNFPATLPGVSMGAYGFKPVSALARTEMETGLARVRRRYTSTPTDFDVTWKLTMAQMGIFEKFYDDDLFDGASWFNINLVNGFGEQNYVARFKEMYSANTDTREFDWVVKATLEVVSRPKSAI